MTVFQAIQCPIIWSTVTQRGYIHYVGLDMYREWKKIELPKGIVYEFGNKKTTR
jgi:hypothetical protein